MSKKESTKKDSKKHKHVKRIKMRHSVGFTDIDIDNAKSSMTLSCTLLFSMSQLFCGIVIPLSDSFVTTSLRYSGTSYYLEIFFMFQYSMAIIGILYLQCYIYISERSEKLEAIQNKNNIEDRCDKESPKVTFSKTPSFIMENSEQGSYHETNEERNQLSHISTNSILLPSNDTNVDTISVSSQINENTFFLRDTEGINLYLRLGAVAFGFGVMVHDVFKMADKVKLQNSDCHNILWIPKHCLHFMYTFLQTFFVFKYHKIIFSKQKSFVRFILFQLAVINICQWFKSVVFEINDELMDHEIFSYHFEGNDHTNHSKYNLTCFGQMSHSLAPYLFPCAIEYGLISAAIFYKILQKVGKLYQERHVLINPSNTIQRFSNCHRSHKGLFVGILYFIATLVGLAVFLAFKRKPSTKNLAVVVYQISEMVLLVSSIIAIICAFVKMRVLKFRQLSGEEALDDNLLLVGLSGVFSYNLFLFISTIDATMRTGMNKDYDNMVLIINKSLIEMLQSFLQVLFILEGSRKCAGENEHVAEKPGKSFLTFLIISNLALWIVSIFEAKRAEEHLFFTNYFQKTPWMIIVHSLLPLIIFFRFHSTICLSDIWTNSYKFKRSYKHY